MCCLKEDARLYWPCYCYDVIPCSSNTLTAFQVVKKLAAVSGIHLTDPAIMRISDAYDLLHEAKVLPKQQKLVERKGKELVVAGSKKTAKSELDLSLLDLPNVKVRSKRIRKEDREKEIGRWKVTGEELRARRLL